MASRPRTIDDYLAKIEPAHRAALETLRNQIRAIAPQAEESFSYGIPAFRLNGKPLAGFAAAARHCSLYPMSGSIIAAHGELLKNYDTSKGAIRFPPEKPLPRKIVERMVKARMAEIARTSGPGKKTKPVALPRSRNVDDVMDTLKRLATRKTRDGMARYGLPSDHALGVTVAHIKRLAKQLGRDHALALALWKTGYYEARMLAAFVDEPQRVTVSQMDAWCRDFDNWGLCDCLCFHLFDRTPRAWRCIEKWAKSRHEFVKRAAFALLWGVALHDKLAPDAPFERGLQIIEQHAGDERRYVKQAVSMALRAIGKRNRDLKAAALAVARRLSQSDEPAARWVGKDATRKLAL